MTPIHRRRRPKKNKTPQRLTTRGAIQDSDGHTPETSSTAHSLYDTHSRCQETTQPILVERDPKQFRIFANGICRPTNPGGWACWAWVVMDEIGHIYFEQSGCVGYGARMSSGVAEYVAVLGALEWLEQQKLVFVVLTDSRLVFNQVSGNWICGAKHLEHFCDRAVTLLDRTKARLILISREQNVRARALSRQAYDTARRGGSQ